DSGGHQNITQTYGLATIQGNVSVMLSYHGDLTLSRLIQKYRNALPLRIAKYTIPQIFSAVDFLHSKLVIHNMLTTENIWMESSASGFKPILGDFSKACRECTAKKLTQSQQKNMIFSHFPPEVLKGYCKPSIFSDAYALGKLLSEVFPKLDKTDETERALLKLQTMLLSDNPGERLIMDFQSHLEVCFVNDCY
ncbi:unnamed protein product, partial [Owenia fusiformis]